MRNQHGAEASAFAAERRGEMEVAGDVVGYGDTGPAKPTVCRHKARTTRQTG